jgi:hypothetical protein
VKPQRQLHLTWLHREIPKLIKLLETRLEMSLRMIVPTPRRPSANDPPVISHATFEAARPTSGLPSFKSRQDRDLPLLRNIHLLQESLIARITFSVSRCPARCTVLPCSIPEPASQPCTSRRVYALHYCAAIPPYRLASRPFEGVEPLESRHTCYSLPVRSPH